ncbi:MAG: LPS export ABC transporter permease LptF [Proteobacteria bacterium]|nr:LPS export ABC transporter permease LptF [Desulfobacteraceae bacterium]MBU4100024.1 LPS export ABC transporter permease LptF [Pseudomonadota bacterium]MBU4421153.1 LPS export ABC transporter permease LptF [Pseudomonadota bacterium]
MKINPIIYKYIFKEMIPPFVISILFFNFIFLLTKILDITNMIVNYRISLSDVLLLLIYSMPHFLEFVIPMSIMMAILLTFFRMSSDNEIVALKAGGMSIYELLPPVLLFCLIGCILTGIMTIYGVHWGSLSFKKLTYKVAASNVNIGMKERTFNDNFKGVMLYTNKIDLKNKALTDVFIEDQRTKNIISTAVAPKGEMSYEPDKLLFQLRLYNGTINQVDIEQKTVHSINFDTYDINLDFKKPVVGKMERKDEKEMSIAELRENLKDTVNKDAKYYAILIEFYRKFSIPFACFALGLLGIPLGVQSKSAKRAFGLGLGLIFFLLYYLMLSAGWVFGEAGIYPPLIGMWMPNIVTGGIGIYLFIRTANDRPLLISTLPYIFKKITSRFKS